MILWRSLRSIRVSVGHHPREGRAGEARDIGELLPIFISHLACTTGRGMMYGWFSEITSTDIFTDDDTRAHFETIAKAYGGMAGEEIIPTFACAALQHVQYAFVFLMGYRIAAIGAGMGQLQQSAAFSRMLICTFVSRIYPGSRRWNTGGRCFRCFTTCTPNARCVMRGGLFSHIS